VPSCPGRLVRSSVRSRARVLDFAGFGSAGGTELSCCIFDHPNRHWPVPSIGRGRDHLCRTARHEPGADPVDRSGRPLGRRQLAEVSHQWRSTTAAGCAAHYSVRRHCVPLVRRSGRGPDRGRRGPVHRYGIPRQRSAVDRDAVRLDAVAGSLVVSDGSGGTPSPDRRVGPWAPTSARRISRSSRCGWPECS
jgi:hypothetical protein